MTFTLYRGTKTGQIVFDAPPGFEILKSFVESELQEDVSFINLLLSKLEKTTNSTSEITGNSHSIVISQSSFQIENLYEDEEPFTGKNKDLTKLLEALKDLLTQ